MPVHCSFHAIFDQALHEIRAHNVLSESRLLQKLEISQGRAGICQVLDVRRLGPVLEVGEVGDKRGLREQLLRREVVEVERVRE